MLSASRAGELDAVALLRYLRSVRPRVLVLMGRAWVRHLRDVDAFKDALLAAELERLLSFGARVYLLDPLQRGNASIELPGGHAVAHRRELRLRVAGQWVWLGDRRVFASRRERLTTWTRAWLGGGRPETHSDRLRAFAEVIGPRALEEQVDAVICGDTGPGLRTVMGEGSAYCTVACPGEWVEGQRSLEFRFERWALRAASPREEGESAREGVRERFVYGRHPVA